MDNTNSIIQAGRASSASPRNRRKLATALGKELRKTTYSSAVGKRTSKQSQMARMMVELVTNLETTSLEGERFKIGEFKEWLDLVKFVHNHLDGNASNESANFNGVNIFKVYAGIDTEKV